MPGEHLTGTEGMSEARDAFRAAMDAESPSRSVKRRERKSDDEQDNRQNLEDVFPNRRMDRSEPEGGADDDPEPVRRARAKVNGDQNFGEVAESDEGDDEVDVPDEEDQPEEPPREPDEDEGEDEEPDEGEDDDEAAQSDFDPNLIVRVTVDGQPTEVSLGEALNGYIRTETFHRRMSELGEGVKALHTARLELDGLHQQQVERGEFLEALFKEFLPQEPDWNKLYQENATQASYLRYQWDEIQKKLGSVAQTIATVRQQRENDERVRLAQFISANRAKIASQHPEWRSQKVWDRDMASMKRSARTLGYSDAEIAQLYDARAMEALYIVSRYHRMMAAKPKPVRGRASPTNRQNGAKPSRNVSRSFDRAEKRLSRSGSLNDAAAVFERILDNEG